MSKTAISAALRQRVAEASRFRCGYCLTSQRVIGPLLEIDHIIPEAHGGSSEEANLFLACPMCNSHKGDRLTAIDPETQLVAALFNPRMERWDDHFAWSDGGAVLQGSRCSPEAREPKATPSPPRPRPTRGPSSSAAPR